MQFSLSMKNGVRGLYARLSKYVYRVRIALIANIGRGVSTRMTFFPDDVVNFLRLVNTQNLVSMRAVSGAVNDALRARDVAFGGNIVVGRRVQELGERALRMRDPVKAKGT